MRTLLNVLLVAILTGFAGQWLGWIAVPVVALIVSSASRELRLRPWHVGAGAALAWAVMLGASARTPAFSELLASLGRVFEVPGFALISIAMLLPFALGWSTSTITSAVIPRRNP